MTKFHPVQVAPHGPHGGKYVGSTPPPTQDAIVEKVDRVGFQKLKMESFWVVTGILGGG